MVRRRLDHLMVERGLVESRSQAQRLVMAGEVRVNNETALKASTLVNETSTIELQQKQRYVSRGGEKLEAALASFQIQPVGLVCADVGASTGGFTDCLLQHGARLVYAIDVGKGILHWRLRTDKRVVLLEKTNARYLDRLPQRIELATVDASFISLRILLPAIHKWFFNEEIDPTQVRVSIGEVIALIKPQFEVGRSQAAQYSGVIRDPAVHRQVLLETLSFAQNHSYMLRGLMRSPILGPKGNTEFLAWLQVLLPGEPSLDERLLERTVTELFEENSPGS